MEEKQILVEKNNIKAMIEALIFASPKMISVDEIFVVLASGSLIFLVFFLIFPWLRDQLSITSKAGPLSPIDRIFGPIYGFIRGFVLICLVYIVFEIIIPNEEEKYPSLVSSFSYPYVKKGSNFLRNSISFTKETTLPEVEK